ncbi:LIF receptor subunit alpha a isoform X2 [Narcine bancroftii]|uniref:LIF receptor subunit alpha a isoform X2 n=1 Tax=Narcine bancroftii TaxID=1343680 RepID=UPI0038316082
MEFAEKFIFIQFTRPIKVEGKRNLLMDDFPVDQFQAGKMKRVFFEFVFLALLLSGCDLALAQNNDSCGSISINTLVVNVNSSHNITCSFCKKGAAENVLWIYGGSALPRSQFIQINSSASMVMLSNLRLTGREGENLTCMSEEESYTTVIQTGYPPDAPRDLKCITQNFDKINCSWVTGRDTNLETNYISCFQSSTNCSSVGKVNFVEHNFVVFEDIILQITARNELGTGRSEAFRVKESDIVFVPHTPKLIRVLEDLPDSQVIVEWFEGGDIYGLDLKMIFQIQILLAYKMQEVWVGNYSSTLNRAHNRVLQMNWTSDEPLQCTSYLVRIRCIGNNDGFLFSGKNAWSEWSPPLKLDGLDVSNETHIMIYPVDGTVLEAGTSPTFCCVVGKQQRAESLIFHDWNVTTIELSNRSLAIKVKNIPPSIESGTNIICTSTLNGYGGATVFIGYPPDAPKNLSCETRDLQTLICMWDPGRLTRLFSKRRTIYRFFNGSSQNSFPCEKDSKGYSLNWCSFPILNRSGETNISIHAKNPLGEAQSSITVDPTRVFRPFAPHQLRDDKTTSNSTNLHWSDQVDYTDIQLHCEIEIQDNSGQVMTFYYYVIGKSKGALHTQTLNNLRPNTEYSIKARYSSEHFWKWSEWSNVTKFKTRIAAPSVSLDVWRTIMPDRTVTIYWKRLSDTEANGPILFHNVTWSKVGCTSVNSIKTLGTNVQIHLDQTGYIITIVAQNSAGISPYSVIKIPPQRDDEDLGFEKVSGSEDKFHVTWQRHRAGNCGYTIQWCEFLSLPACSLDWRKFPSNATDATIRSDTFQAGVLYNLEVYECRNDGDHLLKKLIGYTRELAPVEAPKVEIKKTTGESVQIEWKDIPVKKQRGFIEGFKIYYSRLYNDSAANKPMNSVNYSANITIGPEKRTFKILGLEPGATYKVEVRAFTKGGDSPSNAVTVTTPYSPVALILGIILPLIGFIVLGIMLSIICYQKQEWIKDTFYPDIPDPTNSKVFQDERFFQGMNLCKTLEPKDCTLNEVQVVEDKPIIGKVKDIKGEEQNEDKSENETQHQAILTYQPSRTSRETSGEPNPPFEAPAPLVPCVYTSEVTYSSIWSPGCPPQEAAGVDQMEDGTEVIVKSGYQPQIHAASNLTGEIEPPDLTLHVNGYQPQMHNKSWSLSTGESLPVEREAIGSPTSINSQAFLIPEILENELKSSGKLWSLSFFNSRISSNSQQ